MIDIVEKAENMRSWTKLELELIQEVKRLREGIEHALILSRDNNERVDKLRELIE